MYVAPLVGAWIEILFWFCLSIAAAVAPLVGAWIEIFLCWSFWLFSSVAPLVGAWIEIAWLILFASTMSSLPLWERGLKSSIGKALTFRRRRSPCGSVD